MEKEKMNELDIDSLDDVNGGAGVVNVNSVRTNNVSNKFNDDAKRQPTRVKNIKNYAQEKKIIL